MSEIDSYLQTLGEIGVKRVVLRALYGSQDSPLDQVRQLLPEASSSYRGNAVYNHHGMEVTLWNFRDSENTSLNLFSDGTLGTSYLLAETAGFTSDR